MKTLHKLKMRSEHGSIKTLLSRMFIKLNRTLSLLSNERKFLWRIIKTDIFLFESLSLLNKITLIIDLWWKWRKSLMKLKLILIKFDTNLLEFKTRSWKLMKRVNQVLDLRQLRIFFLKLLKFEDQFLNKLKSWLNFQPHLSNSLNN